MQLRWNLPGNAAGALSARGVTPGVKVAHLTSAHTPEDTRITYRECSTLASAGYDVVLIAAGSVTQPMPPGVRVRTLKKPRNRFERMTRTVWDVLRAALHERAHIYHFHDPELMGVGLLLRALGARVVFDVHEDIPKDIADKGWIPSALRKPLAQISKLVLRTLERRFSAIVTATPSIADNFVSDRTVVVCNFPPLDEFQHGATTPIEREECVIYLGSITEQRCIEEMVRAMASPQSGGARMLLAGTFEDEPLLRRVQKLPGWDRVDYEGQCSRSKVASLLARARAGLLLFHAAANHDDCMPNKLFEYMAASLPIIMSDTINCSRIITESECGVVVDPRDVEAIAAAIAYLTKNPDTAAAMGERARRLFVEHYQWSSEAEKLTKLYAQIA